MATKVEISYDTHDAVKNVDSLADAFQDISKFATKAGDAQKGMSEATDRVESSSKRANDALKKQEAQLNANAAAATRAYNGMSKISQLAGGFSGGPFEQLIGGFGSLGIAVGAVGIAFTGVRRIMQDYTQDMEGATAAEMKLRDMSDGLAKQIVQLGNSMGIFNDQARETIELAATGANLSLGSSREGLFIEDQSNFDESRKQAERDRATRQRLQGITEIADIEESILFLEKQREQTKKKLLDGQALTAEDTRKEKDAQREILMLEERKRQIVAEQEAERKKAREEELRWREETARKNEEAWKREEQRKKDLAEKERELAEKLREEERKHWEERKTSMLSAINAVMKKDSERVNKQKEGIQQVAQVASAPDNDPYGVGPDGRPKNSQPQGIQSRLFAYANPADDPRRFMAGGPVAQQQQAEGPGGIEGLANQLIRGGDDKEVLRKVLEARVAGGADRKEAQRDIFRRGGASEEELAKAQEQVANEDLQRLEAQGNLNKDAVKLMNEVVKQQLKQRAETEKASQTINALMQMLGARDNVGANRNANLVRAQGG